MDKKQVAKILEEIGTLMELKGENPFKVRSYYNAARVLDGVTDDITELVESGRLLAIKGIGKGIGDAIGELVRNGHIADHQQLKASIPPGVLEMLKISGLGPKKVKALWDQGGITSLDQLEKAAVEKTLRTLKGFSEKTETNILSGLAILKKSAGRFHTHVARRWAQYVLDNIGNLPEVQQIAVTGSLRRRCETSRDIDIVAAARSSENIMDVFGRMDEVEKIIARGETKSSILLKAGIAVDLRIVQEKEYPFLLHHFTGSKEHNTLMRGRARKMGLKLNEYGLFQDETLIPCADEAAIFQKLGLHDIPPELREGREEIDHAADSPIPTLVQESDMRGILHLHTVWSDGVHSIEEMVQAARARGAQFIGISDHSKIAVYANGLSEKRVQEQHQEIDRLRKLYQDITIFKGIEADILPDGEMDYSDAVLATFDFVIASVHSKFKMTETEGTERLLRAMRNPCVRILGHPTGRLLLGRDGYSVNVPAIIDAARDANVVIELNANPHRLDLDWRYIRYALDQGVVIAINPDAHRMEDYANVEIGVGVARKGWATPDKVLNTWTVNQVKKFFEEGYGKKN